LPPDKQALIWLYDLRQKHTSPFRDPIYQKSSQPSLHAHQKHSPKQFSATFFAKRKVSELIKNFEPVPSQNATVQQRTDSLQRMPSAELMKITNIKNKEGSN
jgi:hypothetical protein